MVFSKVIKKITTVLTTGILAVSVCMPFTVSAADDDADKNYYFTCQSSDDAKAINKLFTDGYGGYTCTISETVIGTEEKTNERLFCVEGDENKVTAKFYFNKAAFDGATPTVQKEAIRKFVYATNSKEFQAANINAKSIQAMTDCLNSRSSEASTLLSSELLTYTSSPDIVQALMRLSGVIPTWKIIIGIFAILAFLGVGLSTVLDFVFLNVSLIQTKVTGKEDGKKPAFITQSAWQAFKQSEEENKEEGSGFLHGSTFQYLKTRSLELIIFVVAVMFLLFGGIFSILPKIGDIFSG